MNEQIKYYTNKLRFEWDPADLFENLENQTDIIIVDTRIKEAFDEEHIPGAISLPHRGMDELRTQELDKSKTYVCYCNGIGCNGSTKGSLKMTKLGFITRELIGGLEWWKKDGFATEGSKPTEGTAFKCAC